MWHFILSGEYYKLLKTDSACNRVTSLTECSAAAAALGLSDTPAVDDNYSGVTYYPPYCYLQGTVLKYNSNGHNTGKCNSYSGQCICRVRMYSTYLYSFPYYVYLNNYLCLYLCLQFYVLF